MQRGAGLFVCGWAALLLAAPSLPAAGDTPPPPRTRVVAIEIDRDAARLVAWTVKPRPYAGLDTALVSSPDRAGLELKLIGPGEARHVIRSEVGPLCLEHGPDALPHVEGDTILLHRDAFLFELPELAGFDRLEVARDEPGRASTEKRALGTLAFDDALFVDVPAAGPAPSKAPQASTVLWPESFGDGDVYRIFGDPAEVDRRINIVIVPDGYTYEQKSIMETHAAAMVDDFRARTPYKEHDKLLNYILVYAYSVDAGTDQCDCGIVVDTAMGTRFPTGSTSCGHSDNRCLYYGGGCDSNGTTNIATAELRAPAKDVTVIMVNTPRYGGCGGSRAVYSAGISSGTEIALHELGHSLAGLADEYVSSDGCGGGAGGINTSTNPLVGAWPEWAGELGAPREGAQYWSECVYRPLGNCEMRELFQPFCPVCNQRWALVFHGHPRVRPTTPLAGRSPASPLATWLDVPVEFSLSTRLAEGPGVTHRITWSVIAPGATEPTVVATGVDSLPWTFDAEGAWRVLAEVVAVTNFVKPERWGANVDTASWDVDVETLAAPPEVAAPGAPAPLLFSDPGTLSWGAVTGPVPITYNVYRGELGELGSGYGTCLFPDVEAPQVTIVGRPVPGSGWFLLVGAVNAAGEGPLGTTSTGALRASPGCP